MNRFCCTTATIETRCLVKKMIIELTTKTCPRILGLPNQNTGVFGPHMGGPSFQQSSVLNVVDKLCLDLGMNTCQNKMKRLYTDDAGEEV